MENYEQKDMDGVAFEVPSDQLTEEWMAPWSGKCMIDGSMYWVNIYDNVSKAGKAYRKLKFKEMKSEATYANKPNNAPPAKKYKSVDDIPWDD